MDVGNVFLDVFLETFVSTLFYFRSVVITDNYIVITERQTCRFLLSFENFPNKRFLTYQLFYP